LDIFLHGFNLSSCSQHSLKVLLLLNPMCLLKYVLNCEQNFSFFVFWSRLSSIWVKCNQVSEGLMHCGLLGYDMLQSGMWILEEEETWVWKWREYCILHSNTSIYQPHHNMP
jgi:hypothetical protein